ncbi:MAG: hypothetical protein NT121_13910 [Chloroflexi bacterium]|nr:hypothetical protein [Chloroflexota bacterium]
MSLLKIFPRPKSIKIGLRCQICGKTFTQRAECLILDMGTVERKRAGEQLPFNDFFVPARVICPHCQAEDQYALSSWQSFRVALALLWTQWIFPGSESWLQVVTLGTQDGRIMHPFELRAWYAERVLHNPQKVEWRVLYANTLRFHGRAAEAEYQYRAALELAPHQTEALINLAALLAQRGEQNEALNHLSVLANIRPRNEKQRQRVDIARDVLVDKLPLDELKVGNPWVPRRQ